MDSISTISLALWMPEPIFNSVDTLTARQVYSELQGLSDRTLVHLEILEPWFGVFSITGQVNVPQFGVPTPLYVSNVVFRI